MVTSVKVTRERQDGENVLALRLRYLCGLNSYVDRVTVSLD